MWMAKGNRQELLGEPPAELGQVTLSGDQVGVALAGERRNVVLCLPGGYHWRPSRGETVLVVKSGPESAPCVVGAPGGETAGGEVWLSVSPAAEVRLGEDGTIRLTGPVEITGSLTVNGQEVGP